MQGLDPVGRWNRSLNQQGANDIIKGMKHMLSFSVLGGVVRTRHRKVDATSEEEHAVDGVVELVAIVILNRLNGGAKLGRDKCKNLV